MTIILVLLGFLVGAFIMTMGGGGGGKDDLAQGGGAPAGKPEAGLDAVVAALQSVLAK